MEVSLLNVKITFQKNAVVVDGIGNHKNTWADYYSCHATAGGEAGKQTSETDVAGTVADESDVSFTVRWCKKAAAVDSTGYRVVFDGGIYDIVAVDHMNYNIKRNASSSSAGKRGGKDGERRIYRPDGGGDHEGTGGICGPCHGGCEKGGEESRDCGA